MSDREKVLEFQRQQLNAELSAIRRAKDAELNKKYQGKFFKYRNSYGASVTPNDKWWVHYKVIETSDTTIRAIVVSVDCFGTATFEIKPIYPGLRNFQDSTEAEFSRAATKALKHAQTLLKTQGKAL